MGLRFRQTLRLFKGVALTASTAGVGMRVGVPGLNVSVGPSGAALNLGLPGTGLGYRVPLGGRGDGPAERGSTRAEQRAWRAAVRAAEEAERASRRLADAEAHLAAAERLDALAGVLRRRWRAPFNLWEQLAPLPPFVPAAYQPESFVPATALYTSDAARDFPIAGAAAAAAGLGLAAALFLDADVGVRVAVCVLAVAAVAGVQGKRRGDAVRARIAAAAAAHEAREASQRAEHARAEERRRADHEALDAARATVRTSLARGEAAPVAELFEQLLAGMDFPVPIAAEVEFDDLDEADITLELPELDDVPDEKTSLTARGALSRTRMPQGERVALYEDLCCGVALRLVYELLRFVPTLRRVRLRGTATRVDAKGHDEPFVALVLDVDRATLEEFDLDRVDPSTAAGMLGRWGGNRRGVLKPVE